MLRYLAIAALGLPGCGGDDCCMAIPDAAQDAAIPPLDVPDDCIGPGRAKIKFTREESCVNDGAVEWCIPDNDPQLRTTLMTISSTIYCAPGGGRAQCNTGGKLLCSYPTTYPDQCLAHFGEMKPEVWDDVCEVAAQPPIVEIVPMFAE